MLVCCPALLAKDLKGKITTAETGEPIPGANIVVKGTTSGTIYDFDGNYLLHVESIKMT